jgi:hypothetical protein
MTKILDQIPRMKTRDTVNLWRNALGILEDPTKVSQHSLAQRVVNAIGAEWERRRNAAVDPADMFAWPSTEANHGSGNLDTSDWVEEGVLKFMGYKVGNVDGKLPRIRERILSEIFSGPLPPVFPSAYLDEWGDPLSFTNIVFIGDGETDIPCMRLVRDQGGHSIAVYQPGSTTKKARAEKLITDKRADFIAPADYSEGKRLDEIVCAIIDNVAANDAVRMMKRE